MLILGAGLRNILVEVSFDDATAFTAKGEYIKAMGLLCGKLEVLHRIFSFLLSLVE